MISSIFLFYKLLIVAFVFFFQKGGGFIVPWRCFILGKQYSQTQCMKLLWILLSVGFLFAGNDPKETKDAA